MRKFNIIAVLLLIYVSMSHAQFAPVGTAGAQFLQIPLGARPVGMGEAFTAYVSDILSIYWNPAGLVDLKRWEISTSYVPYFESITYQSAAYAYNFGNVGTVGIHFSSLGTDNMDVTTVYQQEGTGEVFSCRDVVGGISYARLLTNWFSVGLNAKFLQENYWTYTSSGWALDLGTLYRSHFRSLRLGMSILNFGPELKFSDTYIDYSDEQKEKGFGTYALPMTFRVGISMDLFKKELHHLSGALDGVHPVDNLETLNLGFEYWYSNILALRTGYKVNSDEGGFSAGAGFKVSYGAAVAKLDYAFNDLGRLGIVHRVSLGIEF